MSQDIRIFAAGIAAETNTFAPMPTVLDDFTISRPGKPVDGNPLSEQLAVWRAMAQANGAAFSDGLLAWAAPSGLTTRSCYEGLRGEMLGDLAAALPVDVVLLNLHGAMIADGYGDCEEDLISQVRALAGPDAVVAVLFDLHCHISSAKIAQADIVITYKEYPHVDANERARELFDLAIAASERRINPVMAFFDCRMVGLYPTSAPAMRDFVGAMQAAEQQAGVLSVSFAHDFPLADLSQLSAKVLVVTDNDLPLALVIARRLGEQIYALRAEIGFETMALSLDAALTKASGAKGRLVVVADQADNVGAGAPGDSTFALAWLLAHGVESAGLAILHDPEAVKIARKAGVGTKLALRLGGKTGVSSGDPLDVEAEVVALADNYLHQWPQQSGEPLLCRAGDVAALRIDGIDVVVGSERCQCFCPSVFADLGLDPHAKQLLVVKSIQHFYGAFAPIADEVIYMAGPGAVSPDPRQVPYRRLERAGLYPWSPDPLALDRDVSAPAS